MSFSSRLSLPFLLANQAQKHVTVNEGLLRLDTLVQLSVSDASLSAPPASPEEGACFIVAAGATSAWSGREGDIAAWQDGVWTFLTPRAGWRAWDTSLGRLLVHDGSAWGTFSSGEAINPAPLVGVNTVADPTNRLAVKSDALLLSHDDVTPGSGDMRGIVNKAGESDTGAFLFQQNWQGRAELGLAGDDDFRIKVSADGTGWHDALWLDRRTGAAVLPNTASEANLFQNGDFSVWQRGTSHAVAASGYVYATDRFHCRVGTGGSGGGAIQRKTFTLGQSGVPGGAAYFYEHHQTAAAAQKPLIGQLVEDVRRMAGQRYTLSFYAKADAAPFDVSAYFVLAFGDGGSANSLFHSSNAFSFTTEWARYALTFDVPEIAGKTLGDGNGTRLELLFPSGQTFTVHLACMKLEPGPFATPFRLATPADELMRCRRYFRRYASSQAVADLAFEMRSQPVETGSGPYDYDAELS